MSKKAFITGGSYGIGRGIARVLVDEGYDIAFTYNTREDEAKKLQAEFVEKGVRAFYYQASLDKAGVAEVVTAQAIADLGGLDLLVCNAGATKYNETITLDGDFVDFIYNLNYRSYMMSAHVAAKHMVESGTKGNIVYISSTRGMRAYEGDAIYGGMKAALNRSVQSMALELAKYGIRVNSIAPGGTYRGEETTFEVLSGGAFAKRIPLGRRAAPIEIGYLVSYLASEKAAYMTGNTVKIDGGLILPGMSEQA